ncbi:hypothetical protein D3C75_1229550 [compost metagenome]
MPDFTRLLLPVEHIPQLVVQKRIIAAGVELIQVHIIRTQRCKGSLQLLHNTSRAPIILPFEMPMKMMPEFGGDHPLRTVALNGFTNQRFG